MGLDAAAFKSAVLLDSHAEGEGCWENDHVRAYIIDPDFHRSLRGLVADRCYKVSDRAITVSNSYGGHSKFRELLAVTCVGQMTREIWQAPEEYADAPFFELIHFADNEGTIGPEAAADLAADFAENREQWEAAATDEWNRHIYDQWAAAFEAAADGGLVRFA